MDLHETIVYFVRHAESESGRKEDEPVRQLTPKGFEDSKIVSEILHREQIEAVISSPYVRAIQTLQDFASSMNIDIQIEEGFRERTLSGPEYIFGDQLFKAIEKVFSEPDFVFPGGESNNEAQQRGIQAMRKILNGYKGKKVAVGIHGNIMTLILNYYEKSFDFHFWKETTKPDIYKLRFIGEKIIEISRIWGSEVFQYPETNVVKGEKNE